MPGKRLLRCKNLYPNRETGNTGGSEVTHLQIETLVTPMRVPGHKGIKSNEETEILVKEGVNTPFSGTETFCGLSSHMKEKLRR